MHQLFQQFQFIHHIGKIIYRILSQYLQGRKYFCWQQYHDSCLSEFQVQESHHLFHFRKISTPCLQRSVLFCALIAIFLVIDIERKNLIHIKGLTFDIRFDLNLIHQFSNFYDFMHCCGTKAGLKKNPLLLYIKNFPLSS